jgi:lactate dehydrogenase-like 2-hydroxyacid dehydrogenase
VAESELGLTYLSLDDLAKSVDVLIVMTSSTDQTRGLIGSSQIKSFRPGMIVVNTARPEIVDAAALLDGIRTGQVSYAAFDGFYEPDSAPSKELKAFVPMKLMITGHIGSLTCEARDGMARKAVGSILSVLNTGADKNIVNGL